MEKRFSEVPSITINAETCSKCGLCSLVCPIRVFDFKKGEVPCIRYNEECVLCGHCLSVCPTNSIQHSGFVPENFKKINGKQAFDTDFAFIFLAQRRSLRNYKKEVPSAELLSKIVDIAGYAPNSPHHRVGWVRNITIVRGYENMKIVSDMSADYVERMIKMLSSWYMKLAAKYNERAKAALGIVPSFVNALREYQKGNDLLTYNAPAAIFIHAPLNSSTPQIDCDAACLLIQLYAEAHGLGTCWNGIIQGAAAGDYVKNFDKMSQYLNIPKGHKCFAAMTIGFPSIKLQHLPERKTEITWIGENGII